MAKKHTQSNPSQSQLTLDTFERETLLNSLNSNQIKIVQHLISGYYPAMVARKLNISRSYLSRFIHKLLDAKLITEGYKDSLQRRAVVYDVSKDLKNYINNLERKDDAALTLCTPHNVRYKRKIVKHTGKPFALDISRFAHAKWKHIRTFSPKGGDRYVFEMQGTHGRYRAIVHPTSSIEMMCVDRNYIPSKGVEESTQILSMSLNEAYTKFVDEMGWCGCRLELGDPVSVGSIHYAFKSKILKDEYVKKGLTKLKVTDTMDIDNSPAEHADLIHAELETPIRCEAVRFDEALRGLPKVQEELRSVQDTILGINAQAQKIDLMSNNIQALCQSGLPLQNLYNQLVGIVAQQGQSIAMMQETLLVIVKNMETIINEKKC